MSCCPMQFTLWRNERRIHTCCALVVTCALLIGGFSCQNYNRRIVCYTTTICKAFEEITLFRNKSLASVLCAIRANAGIYRESQISSEKSNFGLYHPNNLMEWLFQKMILKIPQALWIWRILVKFENSQKIPFFFMKLVKISNDLKKQYRREKSPVDFIFLTYLEDFQSFKTV